MSKSKPVNLSDHFSPQEIETAINVAIVSNTKTSISWALERPETTRDQLLKILSQKRTITEKLMAIQHPNADLEVLKKLGKSRSIYVFLAVLENETFDQAIKDAWLSDNTLLRKFYNPNERYNHYNQLHPKNKNEFINYNARWAIDASKLDNGLKDHIKDRIREAHELYVNSRLYW
jgi:hypothetical protein